MTELITWKNEKRKIVEIKPAEYNPRQLTEKQAKDLDTSLTRFNLADPIIINADNTIIGGHQRINILKRGGVDEVDVRVPSRQLTDHEEKELNLRLNKNLGEWDFDMLAGFDQEMLLDVGFDSSEIDKMFQLEPEAQDDEVPEAPEEPVTKLGDIIILGRHRLMCGDSTSVDDVEKLMDGKKADMVFTDPPYGVKYEQGKFTGKKVKKKFDAIANDELQGNDLYNFIYDVFVNIFLYTIENANFYVWSPPMAEGYEIHRAVKDSGVHIQSQIIWDKNRLVLGRADYHWQHEICWYGYRGKGHYWCGDRKQTSIWHQKKDSTYQHPTQKPVELAVRAIKNSTQGQNNSVMDLFAGSGSTLIACEKTNRICYGMELDPKYCDVIVKRWEDFTGQNAERIEQN